MYFLNETFETNWTLVSMRFLKVFEIVLETWLDIAACHLRTGVSWESQGSPHFSAATLEVGRNQNRRGIWEIKSTEIINLADVCHINQYLQQSKTVMEHPVKYRKLSQKQCIFQSMIGPITITWQLLTNPSQHFRSWLKKRPHCQALGFGLDWLGCLPWLARDTPHASPGSFPILHHTIMTLSYPAAELPSENPGLTQ